MKDVIIIGGGIAGLTCSIYLARYGYKVKIYNNYSLGSLSQTDIVQNFPGFPNGINGYELLNNIQDQAIKFDVQIFDNKVQKINEDKSILLDDNNIIKYDILVIATGMTHKTLSIPNIDNYKFVHYCATCDGPLYKDKIVAVVGGGDTALSQALYLSDICREVKLIVRKDYFRGTEYLVNKVKNKNNIKIYFNSNITEIYTEPYTQIKLNDQLIQKIDGIFISIGFNINDDLFRGKEFKDCYICGDCLQNQYRQAIIAAGEGAKTAINIFKKYSK